MWETMKPLGENKTWSQIVICPCLISVICESISLANNLLKSSSKRLPFLFFPEDNPVSAMSNCLCCLIQLSGPQYDRPVWRQLSCCTWTPGRSCCSPSRSSAPTPLSASMSRPTHSGTILNIVMNRQRLQLKSPAPAPHYWNSI